MANIFDETMALLAETYEHSTKTVTRRYENGVCMQCGSADANNSREINTLVYYLCDECEVLEADDETEQVEYLNPTYTL